MDQPPSKKPGSSEVPAPAPEEPSDENDRPTLTAPFDLQAFARENASPRADVPTVRPPPPPGPTETARPADATANVTPPLPAPAPVPAAPKDGPDASPSGKMPAARLSALWMVDSLASSIPAPPPKAHEAPRSPRVPDAHATPAGPKDGPDNRAAPSASTMAIDDPAAEMRERASLGDYTGALEMADLILAADPGNAEAAECLQNCRDVLEKMYSAKLGPMGRAPIVVTPRAQLRWLSIDHRAGFILSLIDGTSPIEVIIDVSGMPKLDALRILYELVQQRIVSFRN